MTLRSPSIHSSIHRSVRSRPLLLVGAGLVVATLLVLGVDAAPTIPGGPAVGPATAGDVFLLLLYVGLALLVSFLCSVLEAALLSTRVGELQERAERGEVGARRLLRLKEEALDDAISSILILNTVAHTAGVSLAGLQSGKVFAGNAMILGLFPVVLTLLILVLTEIIPKTLGAVHASRLVTPVGLVLAGLVWSMTPVLVLTRAITGMFSHSHEPGVSRGELAAMVAMAAREGVLRKDDSRLVSNVLRYHQIRLEDIMTPRTVLATLPADTSRRDFAADDRCRGYSRIPIHDGDLDQVLGYVLQREVLSALARGADPEGPISEHLRRALFLTESMTVDRAMRRLADGREHLAMVTDEFGGLEGVVTLEDLIETLLGMEIVDELDRHEDLRAEAVRLRGQRLEGRAVLLDDGPAAIRHGGDPATEGDDTPGT